VHRSHASAAALGTSAALAAAFLAQPAPTHAASRYTRANAIATSVHATHVRNTMTVLVQHDTTRLETAHAPTLAVAVCHDCPASQTLVRVLLRHQHRGSPLPTLRLYADRRWPALDTLARHTRSTLVIIDQLATDVRVTPVALELAKQTIAVGVTDVVDLITTQRDDRHGERQ